MKYSLAAFDSRTHPHRNQRSTALSLGSISSCRTAAGRFDANHPANALYERNGFALTGVTGSLDTARSHVTEHQRSLALQVNSGRRDTPYAQLKSLSASGNFRTRFPVAAKIALQSAGAQDGTPVSPTPDGAAVLETTSTMISFGASAIVIIS